MNTGTQPRPRGRGRWLLAATSALALGAVTLTGCAEESTSTTTTTESSQSASAAATYFTTDGNESATTTDPATLPWLIRLDKFVDGQSYLGRSDYESIWKQRTGDEDMTPIVEFMDFINNATDEEFASSLGTKLDVEEFAKYLAIEDLFGNEDTISGPGNNGYLHYNPDTGLMTVVASLKRSLIATLTC